MSLFWFEYVNFIKKYYKVLFVKCVKVLMDTGVDRVRGLE